jgi:hypothetical protein
MLRVRKEIKESGGQPKTVKNKLSNTTMKIPPGGGPNGVNSAQDAHLAGHQGLGAAVVVTAAPLRRFAKEPLSTELARLSRELF